jgi:hypothetical protein
MHICLRSTPVWEPPLIKTRVIPLAGLRWLKQKYFERRHAYDWSFFGEICDAERQSSQGLALPCRERADTSKSKARPSHTILPMRPTSRNAKQITCRTRFGVSYSCSLWYEQRGYCPVCNERITRITG